MINLIKPIYAQIENPLLPKSYDNIASQPQVYANNIIQTIFSIFFIVAVIYFVWHFIMAAYHMIASNGDPKKWEEAWHSITYALIGLTLVFSIFAILNFVGTIFGIEGLKTLKLAWPSLSN
jgi:TRAP-type mannitol/chloroaromatic compound transport system permease small subunit